jgi:D-glycero-D-manno-heptose 1,7-bisphosphate phosphatase
MPDLKRQAVFLDRDGVLNHAIVEDGLPFAPRTLDQLKLIETSIEACLKLSDAGFVLIGVTNQPDIARGLATLDNLHLINDQITRSMHLDVLLFCPHDDADDCHCRKPKGGMLSDGAKDFNIDLNGSIMVGDRWKDIMAGKSVGCHTVFIDRGYNEQLPAIPDYTCTDLIEAVPWILALKQHKT